MVKEAHNCRSCGSKALESVLDLGSMYVTNFLSPGQDPGQKIPLDLNLCNPYEGGCGLVQLKHTTPSEMMWANQYWYKSALSSVIRNDLAAITSRATSMVPVSGSDLVVDIGANDGTLLSSYKMPQKENRIAFEPSKNVAAEARAKGLNVINDFFGAKAYQNAVNKKAKIVTAISMFYDLDDPNGFVQDITKVLDQNGVFIIQQNYLATMISNNAVDNICHEHVEYYSFDALEKLLNRHGLETFDAQLKEVNGGSLTSYIRFKGSHVGDSSDGRERIEQIKDLERKSDLANPVTYKAFVDRINDSKNGLMSFLEKQKRNGKKVFGYGASTRGNTILQYYGINPEVVPVIADKNPDKWGKETIGSSIPIVSPAEIAAQNPDYLLVLTWHFFDEIREQEKEWAKHGGKFIAPLPKLRIV